MNKTYVYKWFSGQSFVGVLDKLVISQFRYNQEINSAGSQIEIELGISLQDAAPSIDTDTLVDEDGNEITDDALNTIVTRLDYTVAEIPALNDRIEVWEHSADYPNGKKMFNGLVSRWSANYNSETTKITVLSYGVQLDNYLVQILPEEILTENSADNIDDSQILYAQGAKAPQNRIIGVGQTFETVGDSEVIKVRASIGNPGSFDVSMTLSIIEGTPASPGSTLGSVTRNIQPQTDNTVTDFTFSSAISITGGSTYHYKLINDAYGTSETNTISIGVESTGTYSDGAMYTYNDSSGWSAASSSDICFAVISASGSIGNQFNSYDPSDIMTELLDNFNALGGVVSYSDSSIETSSSTVSYTFKFNTYAEAVKKCIELAPSNWWWRIDPADDTVYFKSRSSTPTHNFVKDKHITKFNISYSLENMKNTVYFSGGDTGSGTNLQVDNANTASVATYGQWLDLPSDNRVTLSDTANVIINSILGEFAYPKFAVSLEVPSVAYDITTIKPGDIVSFSNFNSLIDSLVLQIYAVAYEPDAANLILAVLPPTQSKRIEDIRRNLRRKDTENNPDTV